LRRKRDNHSGLSIEPEGVATELNVQEVEPEVEQIFRAEDHKTERAAGISTNHGS